MQQKSNRMVAVDDLNIWIAVYTVLFGILASVIIANHIRKKTEEDTRGIMREERTKITKNMIGLAKAQDRVKEKGGDYLLREDGNIVSRHEKKVTIDTIIAEPENKEEQQNDNQKKDSQKTSTEG